MADAPRFVVVTGMSGAGKGSALRFLEDLGYYCVDNLPAPLLPILAELVRAPSHPRKRIAVCVDGRAGEELRNLPGYLDAMLELGIRPDTLFLEASDVVLLRRYSASRRRHPAAPEDSAEEGIHRERAWLEPIRARADLVVDTSDMAIAELRERIASNFLAAQAPPRLVITVMSFGFKYGLPQEADMVLDVRFLPNPFYDEELRPHTGEHAEVSAYVLDNAAAKEFLDRVKGLLKFLIPRYSAESKSYLTLAVGCTGGQHRSVAIAHELSVFLRQLGFSPRLRHRDVVRG